MAKTKRRYSLYDAFESKSSARSAANDLRYAGDTAMVRMITPQAGGRLKYGLFSAGSRKKRRK